MKRKIWRYSIRLVLFFLIVVCVLLLILKFQPNWILLTFGFTNKGEADSFWEVININQPEDIVIDRVLATKVLTLAPIDTQADITLTPTAVIVQQVPSRTATIAPNPTVTSTVEIQPSITSEPSTTPTATLTQTNMLSNIFDSSTNDSTQNYDSYINLFSLSTRPAQTNISAPLVPPLAIQESETFASFYEVGNDINGTPLGIIEYDESIFEDACAYWHQICRTISYEIMGVDFRPGGIIINLRANVANLWWQEVGLATIVSDDLRTLQPVGIILNEEVYSFPEEGKLSDALTTLVNKGNNAILNAIIDIDDNTFYVDAISFNDDSMTIILR